MGLGPPSPEALPVRVSRGHPSPTRMKPCPPKGRIYAPTPRRYPPLWPLSTAAPAWALLHGGGRHPMRRGHHTSALTRSPGAPAPTTPHAAVHFLHFFPSGGLSICVAARVKMPFLCTAQAGAVSHHSHCILDVGRPQQNQTFPKYISGKSFIKARLTWSELYSMREAI